MRKSSNIRRSCPTASCKKLAHLIVKYSIRYVPKAISYDSRVPKFTNYGMNRHISTMSAPVPYTQHSLPLSHFIERFDGTPKHAKVMKTMRYPGPINLTMDCKLKRDGEFEQDKCHPNYVYCFSGKRKLLTCIDGQVFKYGKGCVKMEECEKLWEEEATSTPAPIIEEEEQPLPSFVTSEQKTLVPNVKDCRDKINGVYAMKPCQAWYILCYRENGYMMRCSKGFVMSRRYMMCVGEEFCDE
ncbi:hypothetical protein CAEBREN_09633 [Caenorhabditis brenneri]|uniref:Chitin-binding type-2 domain-containing protein n=1 Tax=Caenorhabditis brenneri TaxID=135651 RepID=G0PB76_CAEBE|nr:hypothetical protein CAEBREN_09633 [Caenorhabditis brenneri]